MPAKPPGKYQSEDLLDNAPNKSPDNPADRFLGEQEVNADGRPMEQDPFTALPARVPHSSLIAAGSPDNYARSRRLANELGVTSDDVEADPQAAEGRARATRFGRAALVNPTLAKATSDPWFSLIASDDTEKLSEIDQYMDERAAKYGHASPDTEVVQSKIGASLEEARYIQQSWTERNILNPARRGALILMEGASRRLAISSIAQAQEDQLEWVQPHDHYEKSVANAVRYNAKANAFSEEMREVPASPELTAAMKSAEGADFWSMETWELVEFFATNPDELGPLTIEALVVSAPSLVAGIAGGMVAGPVGAAATRGGKIAKWMIPAGAASAASFQTEQLAVLSEVFQHYGLDPTKLSDEEFVELMSDQKFRGRIEHTAAAKGIGVAAFDFLGATVASRLVAPVQIAGRTVPARAQAATNLVSQFVSQGVTEGAGEALGQKLAFGDVEWSDVIVEAAAGAGMSVVDVGVYGGDNIRKLFRYSNQRHQHIDRQEEKSAEVAGVLRELHDLAQQSKIASRDPEALKSFVDQATKTHNWEHVHVDGAVLAELDSETKQVLGVSDEEAARAAEYGSFVPVAIADVIAGGDTALDAMDAMSEDIKSTWDGMSVNEAKAAREAVPSEVASMVMSDVPSASEVVQRDEIAAIRNTLTGEIMATGTVDEKIATAQTDVFIGSLMSIVNATAGSKNPITLKQLWEEHRVRVKRGDEVAEARADGENAARTVAAVHELKDERDALAMQIEQAPMADRPDLQSRLDATDKDIEKRVQTLPSDDAETLNQIGTQGEPAIDPDIHTREHMRKFVTPAIRRHETEAKIDDVRSAMQEVIEKSIPEQGWGFLSAELSNLTADQNLVRTEILRKALETEFGIRNVHVVEGFYRGIAEGSFQVQGISAERLFEIGKEYGQESVLGPEGLIFMEDRSFMPLSGVIFGGEAEAQEAHTRLGPLSMSFSLGDLQQGAELAREVGENASEIADTLREYVDYYETLRREISQGSWQELWLLEKAKQSGIDPAELDDEAMLDLALGTSVEAREAEAAQAPDTSEAREARDAPTTGEAQPENRGKDTANFFSATTRGENRPTASLDVDFDGLEAAGETGAATADFLRAQEPFTGHFDEHIETSIPGYRVMQAATGAAIASYASGKEGAEVLDIGGSEGSFGKAVALQSGGNASVDIVDPNTDMEATFRETGEVEGVEFHPNAFGTPESQGQVAWADDEGNPEALFHDFDGKKYDVVHESMTFQFISPDRGEQIASAKAHMKDGGVLILNEKFITQRDDNEVLKRRWQRNEDQKDEFKRQFYEQETLDKKDEQIGLGKVDADEESIVGMASNMVSYPELQTELFSQFEHAVQYWDSGNFKGFVASDSIENLNEFVEKVHDLNTEFSEFQTPRVIENVPDLELFQTRMKNLEQFLEGTIATVDGKVGGVPAVYQKTLGGGIPSDIDIMVVGGSEVDPDANFYLNVKNPMDLDVSTVMVAQGPVFDGFEGRGIILDEEAMTFAGLPLSEDVQEHADALRHIRSLIGKGGYPSNVMGIMDLFRSKFIMRFFKQSAADQGYDAVRISDRRLMPVSSDEQIRSTGDYSVPAEEAVTLKMVHNLGVDSLRTALASGALPAPSIAIVRNEHFHDFGSQYGDRVELLMRPGAVKWGQDDVGIKDTYSPEFPYLQGYLGTEHSPELPYHERYFVTAEDIDPDYSEPALEEMERNGTIHLLNIPPDATYDNYWNNPDLKIPATPEIIVAMMRQSEDNLHEHHDPQEIAQNMEAFLGKSAPRLGSLGEVKAAARTVLSGRSTHAEWASENSEIEREYREFLWSLDYFPKEEVTRSTMSVLVNASLEEIKEMSDAEFGEYILQDADLDELMDSGDMDNEGVEKWGRIMRALVLRPEKFMEAKPMRAVPMSDVAMAVVPDGTDPELVLELQEQGIEVRERLQFASKAHLQQHPNAQFKRQIDDDVPTPDAPVTKQALVDTLKRLSPKSRLVMDPGWNFNIRPGEQTTVLGRAGAGVMGMHSFDGKGSTVHILDSLRNDKAGTLRHEAIHALRSMDLFEEHEWGALAEAARQGGWVEKHQLRSSVYARLGEEVMIEEAVAREFGGYQRDSREYQGFAKVAFEKIRQFFRSVADFLARQGFRTLKAAEVFSRVDEGVVGSRSFGERWEQAKKANPSFRIEPQFYSRLQSLVETGPRRMKPIDWQRWLASPKNALKQTEINNVDGLTAMLEDKQNTTPDEFVSRQTMMDFIEANRPKIEFVSYEDANEEDGYHPESYEYIDDAIRDSDFGDSWGTENDDEAIETKDVGVSLADLGDGYIAERVGEGSKIYSIDIGLSNYGANISLKMKRPNGIPDFVSIAAPIDLNEIQIEEIGDEVLAKDQLHKFMDVYREFFDNDLSGIYASITTNENEARYYAQANLVREYRSMHNFVNQGNITPQWSDYTHTEWSFGDKENYRELLINSPGAFDKYPSVAEEAIEAHWPGESDVIVHVRMSNRKMHNDDSVLLIEEIQSDAHQAIDRERKQTGPLYDRGDPAFSGSNTWALLGFKAALDEAVRSGKEKLIWSSGPVQAHMETGDTNHGMKHFYDKVIPSAAKKYLKRFGVEPEKNVDDFTVGEDLIRSLVVSVQEELTDTLWSERDNPERQEIASSFDDYEEYVDAEIKDFENQFYDDPDRILSNHGIELGFWQVMITDEMRQEILEEGQPLYQKIGGKQESADEVLGSYTRQGGERIIKLFKSADASTFLHESAHYTLDVMQELDRQGRLDTDVKQAIFEGLKVGKWGDIRRTHHEKFARAWETYIFDGEIPAGVDQGFRVALQTASGHLRSVYESRKAIAGGLPQEMDDEVMSLMNRLAAGMNGVERSAADPAYVPAFQYADAGDMTEAEYNAYKKKAETAIADARMKAVTALVSDVRRDRMEARKSARSAIETEARQAISEDPVWLAIMRMRNRIDLIEGEKADDRIAMDPESVRDILGTEGMAAIPKSMMSDQGGMDVELLADIFGFGSGEEMVQAIAAQAQPDKNGKYRIPSLTQEVNRRTNAMLDEQQDTTLDESRVRAAAEEALADRDRSELLAAELAAMRRMGAGRDVDPGAQREVGREGPVSAEKSEQETGEAKEKAGKSPEGLLDVMKSKARTEASKVARRMQSGSIGRYTRAMSLEIATIRQQAIDQVRGMTVAEAKRSLYSLRNAQMRSSREAANAIARGDLETATLHKTMELKQHHMALQLTKAKERTSRAERLFNQWKNLDRKTARSRSASFVTPVRDLLRISGFIKDSLNPDIEMIASVRRFVSEENLAGASIVVPETAYLPKQYGDMTIEQLEDLHEGIKSMAHNSAQDAKLMRAEWRAKIDDLVGSIKDRKMARTDREELGRIKGTLRDIKDEIVLSHRKSENIFIELDGMEDQGLAWSSLFRPINDASNREIEMREDAAKSFTPVWNWIRKRGSRLRSKKTNVAGLRLTGEERLAVALNWGNQGNRDALLNGSRRWTEEQLQAVVASIDDTEWDFIEAVWKLVDSFWGPTLELERRLSGIDPMKVDAEPFQVTTSRGQRTISGGYYPILFDPKLSPGAYADNLDEKAKEMMSGNRTRASTRQGRVITRVGSEGSGKRVWLSLDGIFRHMDDSIHDITHREAVLEVARILNDREFSEQITKVYGVSVRKYLDGWLKTVAAGNMEPVDGIDIMLRHLRVGISVAEMGMSLRTALVQPLGITQTVAKIGVGDTVAGIMSFLGASKGNPMAKVNFVDDRSPYMRQRSSTFDREIKDAGRGLKPGAKLDVMKSIAFWLIGKLDMTVSYSTWLGSYRRSIKDGRTEQDAIEYADQIVRQTQSSALEKDLAAVSRGGEKARMLTAFYTFFSAMQNMQMDAVERTKQKWQRGEKIGATSHAAAQFLWLIAIPALVAHAFLDQAGPDEDDDEGWAEWSAKIIAAYGFGGLVLVREVVQGLVSDYGFGGPPVFRALETVVGFGTGISDGEIDKQLIRDGIMSLGYVGHLPARQTWRLLEAVHEYNEGNMTGAEAAATASGMHHFRR